MAKFTFNDKRRGEMLVRGLSHKAQQVYNEWANLNVYMTADHDVYVDWGDGPRETTRAILELELEAFYDECVPE